MQIESLFSIGAFSYAVSGFYSHVTIGRYTSIGEQVQVGRASHPLDWMSTSPFFYLQEKMFGLGTSFEQASSYDSFLPTRRSHATSTAFKLTTIGHDVYIGHGAFILPGVTIGHGAVIAAMSVVTKDVPPYAVVAGNPASIRRSRFPERLQERLLATAWWRFAPWQLDQIDTSALEQCIDRLEEFVADATGYNPAKIVLNDLKS